MRLASARFGTRGSTPRLATLLAVFVCVCNFGVVFCSEPPRGDSRGFKNAKRGNWDFHSYLCGGASPRGAAPFF